MTAESEFAGMAEAKNLIKLECGTGATGKAIALLSGISKHEPHPAEPVFLLAGDSALLTGVPGQDEQFPACAISIAV